MTAYGGSGGAGIGGGYDEDMSGTIDITGYDTKLTAFGGTSAAGIGAGSGGGWVPDGDMDGTITIDCGKTSDITIDAGSKDSITDFGGAGIGAVRTITKRRSARRLGTTARQRRSISNTTQTTLE